MHVDRLVEFSRLEKPEVLDEVENGFDLDQRTSRHVCEATEFLRTAPADTFGEVKNDAITGTTPLIRQVTFGCRQSIDEWARHNGKSSRVLVGFQVFEDHGGT